MVFSVIGRAQNPPPEVELPLRAKLDAFRHYHTGSEVFRDAVGPVALVRVGPRWVSPPVIWVSSPTGARDVLAAGRGVVDKLAPAHIQTRKVLGDNLFDLAEESWLPRRRALQPAFTKAQVSSYGGEMSQAAEAVVALWGSAGEIDIAEACREMTFDGLTRSVLGWQIDHRLSLKDDLRLLLTAVGDRTARAMNTPMWFPTPTNRRIRAATNRVRGTMHALVDRCRAHPDTQAPLVHALLAARDPDTDAALSDDQIVDELVIFMIAGHDTTATALAYTLWQLGRLPEIQERVRAEVRARGGHALTPEDVAAMPYTVQVLHEALRLCPPAPAVVRSAVEDLTVDGCRVAAGSIILVSIYALHRDSALWDDPLTFDPDRFGGGAMKSIDRWQYMPFSAGRRPCIGNHFAMLEATLALATILRDVHIESRGDTFPIDLPFTAVAAEPIWVGVRRLDDGSALADLHSCDLVSRGQELEP